MSFASPPPKRPEYCSGMGRPSVAAAPPRSAAPTAATSASSSSLKACSLNSPEAFIAAKSSGMPRIENSRRLICVGAVRWMVSRVVIGPMTCDWRMRSPGRVIAWARCVW